MRLDQLTLVNFRGFERLEMDLHPEFTLVLGANGSGKTALIRALSVAAGTLLPPGAAVETIAPEDVRRTLVDRDGLPQLELRLPTVVTAYGKRRDESVTARWRLDTPGAEVGTRLPDTGFWKTLSSQANAGQPMDLPVLARFSSARGPSDFTWKERPLESRDAGWTDWPRAGMRGVEFVSWMRRQTYADLQAGTRSPHLSAVQGAVAECVGGVSDFYFDVRADEARAKLTDGRVLPLSLLSDGYRNVVAMVADLAWRAVVLNAHHGAEAPAKATGVVLIDEIDLHLHPDWQRRVIGDLRRAFPKLQFVATTRSPQVLGSAKAEWVRILREDGVHKVHHVEGRDTNSLLLDVFGVEERPATFKQRLHELFRAIDADATDKARAIAAELEAVLGPNDPDLTRARWMMDAGPH